VGAYPGLLDEALFFLVGLTFLTVGADWLVRGSVRLAEAFNVSPLIVGLTIVAFGTSAPELVVSSAAALRGQPGLAVGNVMGSTVANVGLIVGIGSLIRPIQVHRLLLVRESPLLVLVLAIVMILAMNGVVGRLDGLILVTGFTFYLLFLVRWGRQEAKRDTLARAAAEEDRTRLQEWEEARKSARRSMLWLSSIKIVLGIAGLFFGADLLVDSSVAIARAFNVPESVIGATLVAFGTSLPELASTVAAAIRGLGDIAIGNVIGSNVFNLGLVLGVAALLEPLYLPHWVVVRQVLPALIFCLALIPLAFTRNRVGRWEGSLLLTGYLGFIILTLR
jgi:cation:H+ antiporter